MCFSQKEKQQTKRNKYETKQNFPIHSSMGMNIEQLSIWVKHHSKQTNKQKMMMMIEKNRSIQYGQTKPGFDGQKENKLENSR